MMLDLLAAVDLLATPEFKEGYENSVRSYEIKQYIDDNKDDLGVPGYFDDDLMWDC
jgi:hypothetical protein